MPKLRSRIVAAMLAVMMVFTVVACGDDSSPGESETPQVGS